MMRQYLRRYDYHPDMERLRELLSKVTDEQKLNILQLAKSDLGRTALHEAVYRTDAAMLTTVLPSLQSSERLKLFMMKDGNDCTILHAAVSIGHTYSVKAILNSLTTDQQMQLLTVEEDWRSRTAVEMASGETLDALLKYSISVLRKANKGKLFLALKLRLGL